MVRFAAVRPSRETVMTALFNALVASVVVSFSASTEAGSAVLGNPSSLAGLFVGLPVMGGSLPDGTTIESLAPLTLSAPAAQNVASVSFATGFLTSSRRLKMWHDVKAQPAIFLRGADEELSYPGDIILQEQCIKGEVWIYCQAGQNPDIAPETGLNNLLDAVQAAFAPDDPGTGRYTLGGLVQWARLNGRVEKVTGDLNGQAIAIADVEIFVP